MKNSPNLFMKWPLLTAAVLCVGAHQAKAQGRPIPQMVKTPMKTILGERGRELLKQYGKPTAFRVFPGLLLNKLDMPTDVPELPSTPQWAQSVSFSSLSGGGMVWFYKRNGYVVSYRMDGLGYVEAACIATSEKPAAATPAEFEVSTLPTVVLGEDSANVEERHGKPGKIVSPAPGFTEWTYFAKTQPEGYNDAFATVFTIRDNQVVRVYSYAYMPSKQAPSDRLPSDPSKNGRYFLLKPIVIPRH